MPLKKRNIDKNLTKKGFVKDERRDHIYYYYRDYITNNKTNIYTKMSHNNKDIDDDLISAMSKQLHLSKSDFVKFVQCHIDWSQYNSMMIKRGTIYLT